MITTITPHGRSFWVYAAEGGMQCPARALNRRFCQSRCKFDHFGPQKGRWARNGPFPLKNGFFLVYSTIAEIRSKFDHFGPQGTWARNGPFPLQNGFFLVYSTIADIRSKFDHFGPQKGMGQKRPVSIEKRFFLGLQHNSRNSKQI